MQKILLPFKILELKSFRTLGLFRPIPLNFTVSITNRCNSRCKTCNIWRIKSQRKELKRDEFEWIFESIGKAYWFTLSGGEPFLRRDIAKIYECIINYCSPNIVNIPSNCLAPNLLEKRTREILEMDNHTTLIVNLSLDGIENEHDRIRGVDGNFSRFLDSYERLKKLRKEYDNFRIGIHTVISTYNVDRLKNIHEFVSKLDVNSHIFEVAEERDELQNIGSNITPNYEKLSKAIDDVVKTALNYLKGDFTSRITQSFRIEYYELIKRVFREKKQSIPCYAGFASCQISPYGDVWACCILGSKSSFGNLREVDYDFRKLWHSRRAEEIREMIKGGGCYCPLANAFYTSMLCNISTAGKVLLRLMRSYF
jgi:MoaA/NifB/PqqE/SkfB family radical SAM enzyme